MPQIYNALQLKNGATVKGDRIGANLTQPIQFIPTSEKDDLWKAWNMDWYELQGMKQIRRNARRLLKNYKLANGIIDKSDYIVEEDNEQAELIEILTSKEDSALELKFFPIIPNIVDLLCGEFAKKNDKITYRSVDDISYNEMLEQKREMIEQTLLSYGENKLLDQLKQQGLDPESEQAKQVLTPENIKSLPEIEQFFKKDYRSMIEQWASHQHTVDEERFRMKEMETIAFKDMLCTDREFWHFRMGEDDYDMELWNPITTFYHKSPDVKYISQGNYVGRIDLMSIADIIDKYGYEMTKEQLESLEKIYPIKAAIYPISGYQNDGTFYDASRSHKWNVEGPSLGMRQFTSMHDNFLSGGDDIITRILNESEDSHEFGSSDLMRVTTLYWKSQCLYYHLTSIDENGQVIEMLVDETYKVTQKPLYDTSLFKNKSAKNLLYGDHLEPIWVNKVWGGKKIGSNSPTYPGNNTGNGFNPIYLSVKPVKFQFKGDLTLYGCKLPVEGCVFNDRNSKSIALVDRLKPHQVSFNMVNNQIADILIDELGTIILLDQNALPKNSLGEDWQGNGYQKAFVAMKNFQMLPLDTSISNTENPVGFQHYQQLDLSQTNRLLSRIQLSNYFKEQAFDTVGISPQRNGQVSSYETKGGVEQATNASYARTEMLFVQHSEWLMPRVHQMRTDLAQFYNSTKPSLRLSYITSMDERVNFAINGIDLLSRDLNVFISTKINQKEIMQQIKNLSLSNNTSGASIYDLGNLIKADSLAEVTHVLKATEEKANRIKQQEMQHEKEIEQMRIDAENKLIADRYAFEADQNDKERQNNLDEAEIKAAGYGSAVDINQNKQNDYLDTLEYIDKKNQKDSEMNMKREESVTKNAMEQQKINLKREEMNTKKEIADKALQVARENKNKFDAAKKKK